MKLSDKVAAIYDRIDSEGLRPVWISVVPPDEALSRARTLESSEAVQKLPLYGQTFAVKDNIDVAAMETTAGCPAFAFEAETTATAVQRLLAAGAILIGKTNMDQFATGLVGVRSPYGACSSVYDPAYISGGSSSGSAVAVAQGLVSFSLGTDTAGSGRVPAAFNNMIGLKPTRGLVSTAGVVPACRTLDCVSIFAKSPGEAGKVWQAAKGFDATDPYSRVPGDGADATPWVSGETFRFGCPPPEQLEFFGDHEARRLFEAAVERMHFLGGEVVYIDYTPFRAVAELLYSGPWVSERLAAIEPFLRKHGDAMHPVVRSIIAGGDKHSAVDTFRAQYRLEELRRLCDREWAHIDVMLLPTTGTTYTIAQVEADPVQLNTNLGYYTNFVNLLDLAAVAVPAGFRPSGLPFGVSLIGKAFSDEGLLRLAARYTDGSRGEAKVAPGCVEVAVVGAHLTGQPLNRELTSRGARLVRTTKTAPGYRLFALQNTTPPKPGLVRESGFAGQGIEVEIWSVPVDEFGSFVAGVPAPLGIGTAQLQDGSQVKCFICEPYSVAGSKEITEFGGWRKYLGSLAR
ncbi:MAG: allophanate hydrolase [Bryobacteraceae bacterium]|nr:allophanate hydrolase [Bryobacteraceae bacterium]